MNTKPPTNPEPQTMPKPRALACLLLVLLLAAQLSTPPAAAAAPTQQPARSRGVRLGKTPPDKARPGAESAAGSSGAAASGAATGQKPPRQGAGPMRLVVQQGLRYMSEGFVVFSPDGRLVATGGGGDVVVWEAASGREIRRLTGNEGDPGAQDIDGWLWGAFSTDGRLLAVSTGPNLRLWNVETGRLLWRGQNEANAFFEVDGERPPVSFSADGRQVVVAGTTDRLTWDARTGRLVSRVRYQKGKDSYEVKPPRTAASAGGKFVAAATPGVVTVREKASGTEMGRVRFAEFEGGDPQPGQEFDDRLLALALSPDGRRLITAERVGDAGHAIKLWDVTAGAFVRELEGMQGDESKFRFTTAGGLLSVTAEGAKVRALDLLNGRAVEWRAGDGGDVGRVAVSADGRFVVTAAGRVGQAWEAQTGAELARVELKQEAGKDDAEAVWDFAGFTPAETVTFYKDSATGAPQTVTLSMRDWKEQQLKVVEDLSMGGEEERTFVLTRDTRAAAWEIVEETAADQLSIQKVRVWYADDNNHYRTFKVDTDEAYTDASHLALSPDGRRVLVATANNGGNLPQTNIKVWDVETKRALFKLRAPGFRSYTLAWSPDGRTLATGAGGGPGERAALWDASSGRPLRKLDGPQDDVGEFSPDSRLLLTYGADGFKRIYDAATGAEICRFITFENGDWVVVDPRGRFDTNNLDELRGVHWIAPDAPLRPLPLELFMRDYYEPRLLGRLLAGEQLRPVRAIGELNRVQPEVRIASVAQDGGHRDRASVTVEVSRGRAETGQAGAGTVGGVYDLRLFRDGQLVGHAPEGGGEVKVDPQTGRTTITFAGVKLPRRAADEALEFTAYAFNADRVKSLTARASFRAATPPESARGRVYLITVGVNAYDVPAWNLSFAVNDAREMQRVLSARLARLVEAGEYTETVQVPLVSADETVDGRQLSVRDATKQKVRAVLELLAGKQVDEALKRSLPEAARLREATPDDLVIISFSSHGYADENGLFYLLPSDIGADAGRTVTRELLARAISSDELSSWLRDVDAGELVMIVDACHAAAVVEGKEFKPGPMGARGLGQLAYDKGMRILTATQAADAALESGALGQGLLSYALVRDGLEAGAADFKTRDGSIRLGEWLEFGAERVPQLYELLRSGKLKSVGRGLFLASAPAATASVAAAAQRTSYQQPSLFDFAKRRREVVLAPAASGR